MGRRVRICDDIREDLENRKKKVLTSTFSSLSRAFFLFLFFSSLFVYMFGVPLDMLYRMMFLQKLVQQYNERLFRNVALLYLAISGDCLAQSHCVENAFSVHFPWNRMWLYSIVSAIVVYVYTYMYCTFLSASPNPPHSFVCPTQYSSIQKAGSPTRSR